MESWELPRKEPEKIRFVMQELGWFNLDLTADPA